MAPTCILAARQHSLMRSLKRVLEPEFGVVGMADNLMSLRDSIQNLAPSLVVLDLAFAAPGAETALLVLQDRFPEVPMVGLSSQGEEVEADDPRGTGLAAVVPLDEVSSRLLPVAREVLAGCKGEP